jgi:hypothetical protein
MNTDTKNNFIKGSVSARARVQVTLNVPVDCVWSPDTSVAQIQKQAVESALFEIRRGLYLKGLGCSENYKQADVIDVHVTTILADSDAYAKAI